MLRMGLGHQFQGLGRVELRLPVRIVLLFRENAVLHVCIQPRVGETATRMAVHDCGRSIFSFLPSFTSALEIPL